MLAAMIRTGSGEPLVLLHGVLGSERMWRAVVPLLAPHYEVIAPTALGHRGGAVPRARPVHLRDIVDDAQALLDQLGLARAHLAGNSMGGWVALELARRDRARSVCALSPAGAWEVAAGTHDKSRRDLRATIRRTRLSRPLLAPPARSAAFRRWALRLSAAHGERVAPADVIGLADDLLGCTVGLDLLATDEQLEPLEPAPCPVTLAWGARDRVFPVGVHGARARALVPGARWLVLDDVGHVPMLDDPRRVASVIREACPPSRDLTDAPVAAQGER